MLLLLISTHPTTRLASISSSSANAPANQTERCARVNDGWRRCGSTAASNVLLGAAAISNGIQQLRTSCQCRCRGQWHPPECSNCQNVGRSGHVPLHFRILHLLPLLLNGNGWQKGMTMIWKRTKRHSSIFGMCCALAKIFLLTNF